jgi:hypothetical protein
VPPEPAPAATEIESSRASAGPALLVPAVLAIGLLAIGAAPAPARRTPRAAYALVVHRTAIVAGGLVLLAGAAIGFVVA